MKSKLRMGMVSGRIPLIKESFSRWSQKKSFDDLALSERAIRKENFLINNQDTMKVAKLVMIICWIVVLTSCSSKKEPVTSEEFVANKKSSEPMTTQDQITLGEALVKSNDCSTCHHKTSTLIGPAHTAVAKKYEFTAENVKLLAGKIINGGTGVWGEIPMNAHTDINQANAEAMARYVLSLDGEKEH